MAVPIANIGSRPLETMRRMLSLGFVLSLAILASSLEDDFAFEGESGGDPWSNVVVSPSSSGSPASLSANPVRRQWGVPDAIAHVGRLFRLEIPHDAFQGDIDHFLITGLPNWLVRGENSRVLQGVPLNKDIGEHFINVRAVGHHPSDAAKDLFSVEVVDRHQDLEKANSCDPTFLRVLLEGKGQPSPKQRIKLIKILAKLTSLHHDMVILEPEDYQSGERRFALEAQVGCLDEARHQASVSRVRAQTHDGALSTLLGRTVLSARLISRSPNRDKRETAGSGDSDLPFPIDGEEDDDNAEETPVEPEQRIIPTQPSPSFATPTASPSIFPMSSEEHPHRHHHGYSSLQPANRQFTSPVLYGSIMPTPVLVPVRPTLWVSEDVNSSPTLISATPVFEPEATAVPSPSSSSSPDEDDELMVTQPLPTDAEEEDYDEDYEEETQQPTSATEPSSEGTSTEEPSSAGSSPPLAAAPPSSSQSPPTVPTTHPSTTTEEVIYGMKNLPPSIGQRLPKQAVTAGKPLKYILPEDTFVDPEDGRTRQLSITLKTQEGDALTKNSWLQFNTGTQEIYGLPLEEHVSKWTYEVEAMDSGGRVANEKLEVLVQHHKGRRAVTHEFTAELRLESSRWTFPSAVDWQLRVVDAIARLYDDADTSHITVRAVKLDTDPMVLVWTNDSLPRGCPIQEIEQLYQSMVVNDKGEPNARFKKLLAPEILVHRVTWRGINFCEAQPHPPKPQPGPTSHSTNYPPSIPNQVDHINATVGQLLVFTVPEDTFYDPEDGGTRALSLSLFTMERDRRPIEANHWLQFDSKNQEFYGVPLHGDEGRREYQLVASDSKGLSVSDVLIVHVYPMPNISYNVQFSLQMDVPFESFASSPSMKRRFVEKLRDLFGDRNSSAIVIAAIEEGSTKVKWYNRTLPTRGCPEDEISKLRDVLVDEDDLISRRVKDVMEPEFEVINVGLDPLSWCQGEYTKVHSLDGTSAPIDESQPIDSSEDYLLTFVVPAVVIAIMLLLTGIGACLLYRCRHSGKMAVSGEDERQAFRSKGIPVIFQDELDERPDPSNKSPVIMKEEKPPLPPPEYQRDGDSPAAVAAAAATPLLSGEDAPYQPPPPFTQSRDSARQSRPKPTPTYRKPPPYVPP